MSNHPLNTWLDILHASAPMQGALFIGAGSGHSPLVQWLLQNSPQNACLVEADPALYHHLKQTFGTDQTWTLKQKIVSSTPDPVPFFLASNSAENGLIPIHLLQDLWPNLAPVSKDSNQPSLHPATTLANLMAESPSPINWLFLDCLPATSLLNGAGPAISQWDVIIARVVTDESTLIPNAHFSSTSDFLEQAGFHCIHREPERHPALALAIFVRNSRASLEAAHAANKEAQQLKIDIAEIRHQLSVANKSLADTQIESQRANFLIAEYEKQKTELLKQISQLIEIKNTAEKITAEHEHLLEALTSANEEAEKSLKEKDKLLLNPNYEQLAVDHQKIWQLTQAKLAADKLALERQQRIDLLVKARYEAEKNQSEKHAQIQKITADELASVRIKNTQLSLEKIAAEQLADARGQQIETLTSTQQELTTRQQLMQLELTKTEAQVNLIKELLLNNADQ